MISEKGLPPDAWLGSKNKTFRYRWDVQQRDARRDGVKLTAFDSAETVSVAKNNTKRVFLLFSKLLLAAWHRVRKGVKKKKEKKSRKTSSRESTCLPLGWQWRSIASVFDPSAGRLPELFTSDLCQGSENAPPFNRTRDRVSSFRVFFPRRLARDAL